MDTKKLLEHRNDRKAKKPVFVRQDAGHKKKAGTKYRKPKGYQSKMRLHIKGAEKMPSPGYQSPAAVKGLDRDGMREVIIAKVSDLDLLNTKTDVGVVASSVGIKKRLALADAASKIGVTIKNVDATALKKSYDDAKAARSEKEKIKSSKEAEKSKKDNKKKVDKKEEKPVTQTPKTESEVKEEKKKQEKILIDKDKAM